MVLGADPRHAPEGRPLSRVRILGVPPRRYKRVHPRLRPGKETRRQPPRQQRERHHRRGSRTRGGLRADGGPPTSMATSLRHAGCRHATCPAGGAHHEDGLQNGTARRSGGRRRPLAPHCAGPFAPPPPCVGLLAPAPLRKPICVSLVRRPRRHPQTPAPLCRRLAQAPLRRRALAPATLRKPPPLVTPPPRSPLAPAPSSPPAPALASADPVCPTRRARTRELPCVQGAAPPSRRLRSRMCGCRRTS